MSKMTDEATDAARCLSPDEQGEIAREIRSLALAVLIPPVVDLTLAGVAQRVEHA